MNLIDRQYEKPIKVDNLTVRFGEFTAVDSLSFDVSKGEIFGLLGPNGAGKTTTFKCLTNQVPASDGLVKIFDRDMQCSFDEIKRHFGYVPDTDNHLDEFTGRQNLEFFAHLYDISLSRVMECLNRVELERAADVHVGNYSKGMKKKLLIAREILHLPELLFLDEPTANLDVYSTELIRGLLRDLADNGAAIFMTTHNMHEVEELCDRVAIINQGKLVEIDSPTSFKARNTERIVDVVFESGEKHEKKSIQLTDADARNELAELLRSEIPVTLHTREFDFYDVFLKLTGQEYN